MRLALCLAAALAAQTDGPLPTQLDLTVGAQKTLNIPSLDRIAVGNADIADLRTTGDQGLQVVGMAEGETTLRIWSKGAKNPHEVKVKVVADGFTLKPGEQRVVQFPGLTRAAVGDESIVSVSPVGNDRLMLTAGKEPAKTTLLVWSGDERKALLVTVGK